MTGQTENINGMRMYYEVYGQGEPLVLLHGFTGAGGDWAPFVNGWAAEYQLVIPDLRGHGGSTNPSNVFTFRQSALDVFALLDKLNIERFKAIGVSGGAKTLLHMATQKPDRVAAMVLVSAAPYFPKQARAIMSQFTVDGLTGDEWQASRRQHKHGDEQIRALWAQGNAFKDSYDDMNFTPPLLSTIRASTLVVNGDRDPLLPVEQLVEMYRAIRRAALWIVPGAGHGPIFGEWSEAFAKSAVAFLEDLEPVP